MKKLFLHIGINKTGASAFQKMLKDNRKTLSEVDSIKLLNFAWTIHF